MITYAYHRPTSLAEAWALAEQPNSRFIAGGTDLMVKIRDGKMAPDALISLRNIEELHGIAVADDGSARIGAATPVADLLIDAGLAAAHPLLIAAARRLAGPQVRNVATIGGNLCNASPCADTAPPLLVLEATLEISGSDGTRTVALEEFFVAPGQTRLAPGEVLTAIDVPPPSPGARGAFQRRSRVRMDVSMASVAVLLTLDGSHCTRARLAAGSVGPRPLRLPQAEALLAGQDVTEAVIASVRAQVEAEITPISDVRSSAWYRRRVTGAMVLRAIEELLADGQGGA